MNIAYYMPFKPMGHKNPSGDLVTGTELFNHLAERNHTIELASMLRCRWIYYRPAIWLQYLIENFPCPLDIHLRKFRGYGGER